MGPQIWNVMMAASIGMKGRAKKMRRRKKGEGSSHVRGGRDLWRSRLSAAAEPEAAFEVDLLLRGQRPGDDLGVLGDGQGRPGVGLRLRRGVLLDLGQNVKAAGWSVRLADDVHTRGPVKGEHDVDCRGKKDDRRVAGEDEELKLVHVAAVGGKEVLTQRPL